LYVLDLNGGAELHSRTAYDDNEIPFVQHDFPILPGEKKQFKLEFYVPGRRWDAPVTNILLEVLPSSKDVIGYGTPVKLGESVKTSQDQSIYLGFKTMQHTQYYIQYSSSPTGPWQTSPISVIGNGKYQVWLDSGPPKSIKHPSHADSRFYRILAHEY
ncbi:MAG: hypothetical protein VW879_14940, partial [Opitutae bacterium]